MENEFNVRLKTLRDHLRLSQREMAESIGVRQSYYSDIENGRRTLSTRIIEIIKKRFNVTHDWIYTGKGSMFTTESKFSEGYSLSNMQGIGPVHRKVVESQFPAQDREFLTAIRELPEITAMLANFVKCVDIQYVEMLSEIGAAWGPGTIDKVNAITKMYPNQHLEIGSDHYKVNLEAYLRFFGPHKAEIIELRKLLYHYLSLFTPLDTDHIIKLPSP